MDTLNSFFSVISGGVEKIYSKVTSMFTKPKASRFFLLFPITFDPQSQHLSSFSYCCYYYCYYFYYYYWYYYGYLLSLEAKNRSKDCPSSQW